MLLAPPPLHNTHPDHCIPQRGVYFCGGCVQVQVRPVYVWRKVHTQGVLLCTPPFRAEAASAAPQQGAAVQRGPRHPKQRRLGLRPAAWGAGRRPRVHRPHAPSWAAGPCGWHDAGPVPRPAAAGGYGAAHGDEHAGRQHGGHAHVHARQLWQCR